MSHTHTRFSVVEHPSNRHVILDITIDWVFSGNIRILVLFVLLHQVQLGNICIYYLQREMTQDNIYLFSLIWSFAVKLPCVVMLYTPSSSMRVSAYTLLAFISTIPTVHLSCKNEVNSQYYRRGKCLSIYILPSSTTQQSAQSLLTRALVMITWVTEHLHPAWLSLYYTWPLVQ